MDGQSDGDGRAAEGFVDALMRAARESAAKTAAGVGEIGGQVGELGGAVAKLAGVVERMAAAVTRTKADADESATAVSAADWFWGRVKAVLADHRKKFAGGLAAAVFGFGGGPVGVGSPAGASEPERLWRAAQECQAAGDGLTAAMLLDKAAAAGHPKAAAARRRLTA